MLVIVNGSGVGLEENLAMLLEFEKRTNLKVEGVWVAQFQRVRPAVKLDQKDER